MFNGSATCYRAAGLRVTRLNQGIQVDGKHGRLEYFVLPVDGSNKKKTTNMNGQSYNVLIKSHFPAWRRSLFPRVGRVNLVKDHERCLQGYLNTHLAGGLAFFQLL